MKRVIGLTGGIGSGKSTVAKMFAEHGVCIVDADAISRNLTAGPSPVMDAISSTFGIDFVLENGALDRNKMRERISLDAQAKTQLEAIIHPAVRHAIQAAIADSQGVYTMIDIPLLAENFEAYRHIIQRVLVVEAPIAQRVARVQKRSQLSEPQIHSMMALQATDAERRKIADDIIDNQHSIAILQEQVHALHLHYLKSI